MKEKTTMSVYRKDRDWLMKIKKKMKKSAIEDVLHSIIKLVKYNKMEDELR